MNWNSADLICCDAPAALADHDVRDVVFAVGTFDGLHRGHVAVIRAMLDESRRLNATPAVLTFRPHPRAVLTPDNPPPLLMSPERKLDILASLGVKAVVTLPFTKEFAALSPEDFLTRCLVSGSVRVRGVCAGSMWRFGARGAGDAAFLEKRAAELGFVFRAVPELRDKNGIVSSTKIREALAAGDVAFASSPLTRARETAERIAEGMGLAGAPVPTDARLGNESFFYEDNAKVLAAFTPPENFFPACFEYMEKGALDGSDKPLLPAMKLEPYRVEIGVGHAHKRLARPQNPAARLQRHRKPA